MIVSIIVAADERNGIGCRGQVPWRLPADLKRFKDLTIGHCLIMGRKTFESIGKPLPGRQVIVITRRAGYVPLHPSQPRSSANRVGKGGWPAPAEVRPPWVVGSLEQALQMAEQAGESKAFIAGGGEIYAQSMRIADKLYLTRVHTVVEADTFFPAFDPEEWQVIRMENCPVDDKNPFASTFYEYDRVG